MKYKFLSLAINADICLESLLKQLSHPHNQSIKPMLISIQHIKNLINIFLIKTRIAVCELIQVSVRIQNESKGEWFVGMVVINLCKFKAV